MKLKNNEVLEDLQFNNLFIIQNKEGYRFTSDAVSLANFVKVRTRGKAIDLCSGSGVIGILVSAKNNIESMKLVEIQESLAEMSQRSVEYNNLKNIEVINKPLQGISKEIGEGIYDVVTCNPPYKKSGSTKLVSVSKEIAIAKHEITVTLEEIISEASKLLKYGGEFYTVNKEERLTDILVTLRKYNLEAKELVILPSKKGASIIMLRAKKGGKSGIKISL